MASTSVKQIASLIKNRAEARQRANSPNRAASKTPKIPCCGRNEIARARDAQFFVLGFVFYLGNIDDITYRAPFSRARHSLPSTMCPCPLTLIPAHQAPHTLSPSDGFVRPPI